MTFFFLERFFTLAAHCDEVTSRWLLAVVVLVLLVWLGAPVALYNYGHAGASGSNGP